MQLLNNELEKGVIRYLVDNPDSFFENSKFLIRPALCGNSFHQELLTYITKKLIQDGAISLYNLYNEFKEDGGNLEWLKAPEKMIRSNPEFKVAIKNLVEISKRRQVFDIVSKARETVKDDKETYEKLLGNLFTDLIKMDKGEPVSTLDAIYNQSEENMKLITEGTRYGTGIKDLDEVVLGFVKSHVHIVGAYTGVGKSWYAIHCAKHILQQGGRVAFFSLEMSADENLRRMLGTITKKGIDGFISSDERKKHTADENKMMLDFIENYRTKIEIFDSCRTIYEIAAEAKRMIMLGGLDVIFVDFIQNIVASDNKLYEAMREVAIMCQELAKEMKVCVVLLSQLSNEFAQKGGVFQYKGAGEIAQIADLGLMLYDNTEEFENIRPEYKLFDGRTGTSKKPVLIEVVKSRHTRRCHACVMYEFPSGRVIDISKDHDLYWIENKGKQETFNKKDDFNLADMEDDDE